MNMFVPAQPFRLDPLLPVTAVRTYQIHAPRSTHWRDATCEEVDCENQIMGFRVVTDPETELGQRQARYIRNDRSRSAREMKVPSGLIEFWFGPGNKCFAVHRVPLEREPNFIRREGDWRGNPRGTEPFIHQRPEHWVEDFAEHQDKLNEAHERG